MKNIVLVFTISILLGTINSCSTHKSVCIVYDENLETVEYGVGKLQEHFKRLELNSSKNRKPLKNSINFSIILDMHSADILHEDGYSIERTDDNISIIGKSQRGCLYGIMDLIEQIGDEKDLMNISEKNVNAALSFRAIKFNLPWSPYRGGPHNDVHIETCRDLSYWESFLDMMVANRFNALTLWSKHIFPYMIKADNYPLATPFSDQEIADWKNFWTLLLKMAKVRGIETYLLNWNIIVSPEFADAYNAEEYFDRSELVEKYTRESVTQLINEYEDLTGLGVTLADWMGNRNGEMAPEEREDWIERTIVQGMKEADREVKFIHRSVLAGDPAEMRRVIDNANFSTKTIVESKFNWSHGHSTPRLAITHSDNDGQIMEGFWNPKPENFFIAWTIRNEDFFVLRWGEPDFIRKHIDLNNLDYVDGYFIGSEAYIPATDYSHIDNSDKTWNYAFEKQWMFYHTWGRLLYNPRLTNDDLAVEIERRYPKIYGSHLLKAYSLASRVPLYLASFYKATWDLTLYSEGFLSPYNGTNDDNSPFISIQELINRETLSPDEYMNIKNYYRSINSGKEIENQIITPVELSEKIFNECNEANNIIAELRTESTDRTLNSELDDLETWINLGYYFADKLLAGVALENYNITKNANQKEISIEHLEKCFDHWEKVVKLTMDRYQPMPNASYSLNPDKWPELNQFHWSNYLKDVEFDITYVKSIE